MGMPKFIQDMVGQVVNDVVGQLTKPSDQGCDQAAGQQFGGDIQNLIQDLTKMIMDNVKGTLDQNGDESKCQSGGRGGKDGKGGAGGPGGTGGAGGSGGGTGVSGGSWLEAIAKAMGSAAGEKAAKLVTLSQKLNDIATRTHDGMSDKDKQDAQAQDAKEQSAVNAEFQAVSQEFSMLQTAFSTALKGIGEGITKMASKQ
jgi:hypothetical protein